MSRFLNIPELQPVDYSYKFPFLETYSVLKGRQDLIDKQQETGNAALDWAMKAEVDPNLIPWKNQKILEYKSRYDKANEMIYEDPSNIGAYQKEIRNATKDVITDTGLQTAIQDWQFIKSERDASAKSNVAAHNNQYSQNYNQWVNEGFEHIDPSTGEKKYNSFSQRYPKNVFADVDYNPKLEALVNDIPITNKEDFKFEYDELGQPKVIWKGNSQDRSYNRIIETIQLGIPGIKTDSGIMGELQRKGAPYGLTAEQLLGDAKVNSKGEVELSGELGRVVSEKYVHSYGVDASLYPGYDKDKIVTPQGDAIVTLPSQPNDKFSSAQKGKDIKLDPKTGAALAPSRSTTGAIMDNVAAGGLGLFVDAPKTGLDEVNATIQATKDNIANQFGADVTNAQANKVVNEIFDPRNKDKDNTISLRTYSPKYLEYQYAPDKKNNVQQQRTETVMGTSYSMGDIYTREVVAPFATKDPSATNTPQPAANILNDNNYVTAYQKSQSGVAGIVSPINPYDGLYIGEVISIPDAKDAEDMKSDAGNKYMYALPNQSKINSSDRQMFTELHNASQGLFDDTYTKVVGPYNDAAIPEDRLMKSANTPVEIEQYLFLPAVGEEFSNVPEDRRQDVINAASANDIYYAITPKPVIQQNLEEESDSPNRYSFAKQMAGDVYAYYKKDDKFYPVLDTPISDVNTLEQLYLTKAKSIFLK